MKTLMKFHLITCCYITEDNTLQSSSFALLALMFSAPKTFVSLMYKWELFLFQIESVDLALKFLDGYDLRGHKLHVERAKFQMKGNYDPSLKPKKQKKKDKEKLKKIQEK